MNAPQRSLNRALEDVRFCPRCGAEATVSFPRSISCATCGYAAFYNPKPVACAVLTGPSNPGVASGVAPGVGPGPAVVLMRRATEPSKGLWTMPGGYVDLGETPEAAAAREIREEVGVEARVGGLVGVYSDPGEHTVTIVYAATTEGTPRVTEEALEVRAFDPADIPWQALAFWSDAQALRDFLGAREPAGGVTPR